MAWVEGVPLNPGLFFDNQTTKVTTVAKKPIPKTRDRIILKPTEVHIISPLQRDKVPLDEFFDIIAGHFFWKTPMLPGSTRCVAASRNYVTILIEEAPAVRTITYEDPWDTSYPIERRKRLAPRLAFPYVVFVLSAEYTHVKKVWMPTDVRCFYGKKPISNLDDPLFLPNLTNINAGQVCGTGLLGSGRGSKNMKRLIETMLQDFWGGTFNADYRAGFMTYADPESPYYDKRLATIEQWQAATLADPHFMLRVYFKKQCKVRDVFPKQWLWTTLSPPPEHLSFQRLFRDLQQAGRANRRKQR